MESELQYTWAGSQKLLQRIIGKADFALAAAKGAGLLSTQRNSSIAVGVRTNFIRKQKEYERDKVWRNTAQPKQKPDSAAKQL